MKPILTYGHGTHNDFILFTDLDEELALTPAEVAALCDRNTGLGGHGADGLIRVAKRDGKWFMDYRNNDGSIAEMCGNGIRVMARYLIAKGLQAEGIFAINTRAGMKYLAAPADGDIAVNLGQVSLVDDGIEVSIGNSTFNGWHINVGNPHAAVFVDDLAQAGDLIAPPKVSPDYAFPDGVNVEFLVARSDGEIDMRVFERGVGETQSCGTGTVAAALAATINSGKSLPVTWFINPPGGRLKIEIDGHSNATLTGAAVLIEDQISPIELG